MGQRLAGRHFLAFFACLGTIAVGVVLCNGTPPRAVAAAPPARAEDAPRTGLGLVVTPLPDWFKFQTSDTVNGWIDSLDSKSITQHAWELWGALTTLTDQELNGQKVPIYETWWDSDEALLAPAQAKAAAERRPPRTRKFERPRQFLHEARAARLAGEPDRPTFTLFDDVKYNDDIKNFISDHKYNDHAELDRINNGWGASKPIAERKLLDFPNTSVMLKPVYRVVSGKSVTVLPYWAGPVNSSSPDTPGPRTWTKKMVVIPPDLGFRPAALSIRADEELLPSVPVSDFYNIKLTKDEAQTLGAQEGDYAILVGMHVSSREIDNWTWQTFWWSLKKPPIPDAVKGRVAAPFDHYQVAVGYSFMTEPDNPSSLTTTCYNPYLEANFGNSVFVRPKQLGIESNCMSCHRCAAWPAVTDQQPNPNYVANGIVDPADPAIFAGKTKTDFLWGVADGRP